MFITYGYKPPSGRNFSSKVALLLCGTQEYNAFDGSNKRTHNYILRNARGATLHLYEICITFAKRASLFLVFLFWRALNHTRTIFCA